MGLDTTHDCWNGSYGSFGAWREHVERAAGIPLGLMEGYFGDRLQKGALPGGYAYEWARSREGGPLCHDPNGPVLAHFAEDVARWAPIAWESLAPDPLHDLLNHSDCDGWLPADRCAAIADRLEAVLPKIPDGEGTRAVELWRDKTRQFIAGLRAAAAAGEDVEFR